MGLWRQTHHTWGGMSTTIPKAKGTIRRRDRSFAYSLPLRRDRANQEAAPAMRKKSGMNQRSIQETKALKAWLRVLFLT